MRSEKLLIKQIICKIRQFTKLHLENNDSEWNQNTYAVLICKNHPGWESKTHLCRRRRSVSSCSVVFPKNCLWQYLTQYRRQLHKGGRKGKKASRRASYTSFLPQPPNAHPSPGAPPAFQVTEPHWGKKQSTRNIPRYWSHLEDFPLPHYCTSRYTGVN